VWLQSFVAISYKEFRNLARTWRQLRRNVTAQIFNFVMLAWLSVAVRDMPTVIVDQDHSDESRLLVERIQATHTFEIKYMTSSLEQARIHIRAGRAKAAILIPPDYSARRSRRGVAEVLALVDGSDATSSSQATAAINGVVGRLTLEAQQEIVSEAGTVTPHTVLLYNPQGSTTSFMLPGIFALSLGLVFSQLMVRRVIAERMGGNIERLVMTPMSYTALIVGKMAPFFVLAIANSAVYLTLIRFGFDVPIRGSLVLLVGTLIAYIITVMSAGALVAANAKTAGEAMNWWGILMFPSFWLSGYIFPLSNLPKVLLPVSYAMPQTHFIEIMRGVCLRGANFNELAPHVVYLLIAPVVMTLWAAYRFKKSTLE
jgi:ABC-2 type transport system permease protein